MVYPVHLTDIYCKLGSSELHILIIALV